MTYMNNSLPQPPTGPRHRHHCRPRRAQRRRRRLARPGQPPPPVRPPATPVSVATVVQRDVATWDEFSGRLEAVERVDVRSRVAGAVQSVHFREGALVQAGRPARHHRSGALRGRSRARRGAGRRGAGARRLREERARARAAPAGTSSAIAQRELDERINAQREAEANLRAAQAALQSARLNLGYTQVRAPVAGRVGKLEVTVGNLVAAGPGAPVLTTLVSVSPIYASFDADEQVVARALKDLPGGASARAQLERIPVQMGTAGTDDTPYRGPPAARSTTRSTRRAARCACAPCSTTTTARLMPGQFARCAWARRSTDTGAADQRARGRHRPEQEVRDGRRRRQQGRLPRGHARARTVDGLRVVTTGLKAGERIVVNGLQRVRPGALVAPQPVTMDAKAEVAARQRVPTRSPDRMTGEPP